MMLAIIFRGIVVGLSVWGPCCALLGLRWPWLIFSPTIGILLYVGFRELKTRLRRENHGKPSERVV